MKMYRLFIDGDSTYGGVYREEETILAEDDDDARYLARLSILARAEKLEFVGAKTLDFRLADKSGNPVEFDGYKDYDRPVKGNNKS
jgi:deferrochelatase/peroxidase EfeB